MNIRCFLFKKSQNHFCVSTLIARHATTFAKVLIACRATTFSKAYFLTSYLLPKNRPCGSHLPLLPLLPLLPSSPVRLAPHYSLSPIAYPLSPTPLLPLISYLKTARVAHTPLLPLFPSSIINFLSLTSYLTQTLEQA